MSAPETQATSRTQLALVSHEVSGNQQVIQAAVVHRAVYALAAPHDQRDPPQHNAGGKKANQFEGRTQRRAEKKGKDCEKQARANALERVPTSVEIARFAEMCASGTSLLTLLEPLDTSTTDTETVFGAEQDMPNAVVEAVRAITNSQRVDANGRLLASPIDLRSA